MSRLIDKYRLKVDDNLGDPQFWNRILDDLDNRLHAREQDGAKIDGAVEALTGLALQRLNDTFTPIVQSAIEQLASVGALFEAESLTEATIALGPKAFVLTDATRSAYVQTRYVAISAVAAPEDAMLVEVLDYDRSTGVMSVDVLAADGIGETHAAWKVAVSAPPDLDHATRIDNPHATTASQVGAYTTAQVNALFAALTAADVAITPIDGFDAIDNVQDALAALVGDIDNAYNLASNVNSALPGKADAAATTSALAGKADAAATTAALADKVAIASIINNLTSGGTAVPLSAEQGKILKQLIDAGTPTRNFCINGDLQIWQRGTSITYSSGGSGLLADRFRQAVTLSTGNSVGFDRSTTLPTNARAPFSMKITGASGITSCTFGQRLRSADAKQLKRTITVRAKIFNDTGGSITPQLLVGTPGGVDNFTSVTNRLTQNLQACANSAWTTVSHTFSPAAYTNVDNGLQIDIEFGTGLDGNGKIVYITELEIVTGTLGIEQPLYSETEELGRCSDYLRRIFPGLNSAPIGPIGRATSATLVQQQFQLSPPMWKAPSLSAPGVADFVVQDTGGTDRACSAVAITGNSRYAAELRWTTTNQTTGDAVSVRTSTSGNTAYVDFVAEL